MGLQQTRSPLVDPAAQGAGGDAVAAGHIAKPLVVTEDGQDDDRDPAGRQLPPPRPDLLEVGADQAVDGGDGGRGQREADWVDRGPSWRFFSLKEIPDTVIAPEQPILADYAKVAR
ncbi:hypothetical protein HEP84_58360 [Streptomyces sp. RLB1-33]|nr:hypothetical protein [Streptomyces sp. RLB1-33]